MREEMELSGVFRVVCRDKDGNVKWRDEFKNTVVTVGKNLALDTLLGGAGYTTTGPYMGLISATSYSAINAGDTMASHSGWLEAGNAHTPTYAGTRGTVSFSAASSASKASSATTNFTITGISGQNTIKGAFIVLGTGAVNTIDSTAGALYSAGLFSGGDQVVAVTDILEVSYTASA